jgi:hypothetical protein
MIEYQYADSAEREIIGSSAPLSANADEVDVGGIQSQRSSFFHLVTIFWLIP